ncbi:MAG TPA: hypothetical protein VMU95_39545 [Trebonia sp.]|nr:hypothetical protein [Trebonia sp.]
MLRSLEVTEPPALTEPLAVTGGHAPAHAPEHCDASPVSFTHRYTARPDPSVRNVVPDALAVVISVAPDEPAEPLDAAAGLLLADAPAAGDVLLLELPPLLHAATRIAVAAAPTSTAPIRSTGGSPCMAARSRPPAGCTCSPCVSVPELSVIGLPIYIVSLRHDPWVAPVTAPPSL